MDEFLNKPRHSCFRYGQFIRGVGSCYNRCRDFKLFMNNETRYRGSFSFEYPNVLSSFYPSMTKTKMCFVQCRFTCYHYISFSIPSKISKDKVLCKVCRPPLFVESFFGLKRKASENR